MRALAGILITAVAVAMLACDAGSAPLTSGIEGQALQGPTCPVEREDMPCPDEPLQATVIVWDAEHIEKVVTFTTDEEGRFRVPLPPGEYYVDPQPPNLGAPPTPISQMVTVGADQFVRITIEYDSGIR